MKGKSRFRTLVLLMGLVLLTTLLPGIVSAQPTALFTANITQGQTPLTVQFIDQSVSPGFTSFSWDVNNDGVVDFTSRNPVHTYRAAGTYSVKHTVTNTDGSDSEVKTNYITVSPLVPKNLPTALFTANITQGQTPLTVQFIDQSVSPGFTSFSWDVNNDGVVDFTSRNPVHTYRAAGTYSVKHTVTNTDGSDSEVKTNYITVSPLVPKNLPTALFTANITQGQAPLTVQLTDRSVSTGTTSYQWDINNDGVVESTLKNPVLTYTTAGNKTVKLTVTNASGSDSEVKTNYITVSVRSGECFGAESCNPTGNPIGGGAGYTKIITETDSRVKYVVSTKDQLLAALKSARSGEVVYVKGDANIDLTGTYGVTVPAGVTLASNRGKDGSAGGRIFQNRISTDPTYAQITSRNCTLLKVGGDNVRITGLRLEGPDKTTADLKSMKLGMKNGIGVWDYRLLEVDNCEIWGWGWAGVALRITSGSNNAYIHHNYIHHCQDSNVGYGVAVTGGTAVVEANLFDYTKHAVTGSGL